MKNETTAIYNENCVMRGRAVPQRVLDENACPEEEGCDDWSWYELTEYEARHWETQGDFGRLVAATIREML